MTDVRGLAIQAVALKVLADRVDVRQRAVKRELAAALDPGDRKTAALDDGTKVGTVTYSSPDKRARVVNDRTLADWVADHYPDEVIPTVRPAFLALLLDTAKKSGTAVDVNTGEVIPGIDVGDTTPYLSVRPDPEAVGALVDAIRAGQLLALEEVPHEV